MNVIMLFLSLVMVYFGLILIGEAIKERRMYKKNGK
jgi:hypothetical protein